MVTNDAALAERARLMCEPWHAAEVLRPRVWRKFRLDDVQASLLGAKAPHLGEYPARRRRNARVYQNALSDVPGVPAPHRRRDHIVNQYTVRTRNGPRDALRRHLAEHAFASEIYYLQLHKQECFRTFDPAPSLRVAEAVVEEALSPPVFPEPTEEEQRAAAAAIVEFAERRNG